MAVRDVDVLLVEDDEAIRDTLGEVLQEEGYGVVTAVHGAQALEKLLAGLRPQIILLDLMMPVMDGWQLLQQLHRNEHLGTIPVVVVSAARDSLPMGASRYLHKPLDIDTLLDAIAEHCQPGAAPPPAGGTHGAPRAQR